MLHLALSPTEPEDALLPSVRAIRDTYKVSHQEAWEQLRRFHRDLVSPLSDPNDFVDDWRTPAIVKSARTMYESSEFNAMPGLADALEQAGCDHQSVLDHCRDTKVAHIRGCWVLDAILQDWIQKRPSPTKVNKLLAEARRKKTRFSRVAKRGQDRIVWIMEERDGDLPLEEFLAKRWDVAGFRRPAHRSDEEVAKTLAKLQSGYQELQPDWSADQIQTVMSLGTLTDGLRDAAIARRFALDEPGELARGLTVANRLHKTLSGQWFVEFKELLEICAVRDVAIAQGLVKGARAGYTAIPTDWHLSDIAVTAILQKDFETLRLVTPEMPKHKVAPWLQGIYTCLTGVAEQQPHQVATGLELLLTGLHRMRQKDELEEAINLGAQGLHRLCEWVSPDLVSEFDVSQAMPWDAAFHDWCQNHPDPLAGVDLSGISPLLHEAVVLGNPPAWLTPPPEQPYEIVLHAGDPGSPEVLKRVGGCAGTGGSLREAKALLKRCPVVLRWNLSLDFSESQRQYLEELGASAEVRPMARTPFRFC